MLGQIVDVLSTELAQLEDTNGLSPFEPNTSAFLQRKNRKISLIRMLLHCYEMDKTNPSEPTHRSPERDEIMRREYPKGTPNNQLCTMLNALPGATLYSPDISDYASRLKLRRPTRYTKPSMPPMVDGRVVLSPVEMTLADALEWGRRNGIHISATTGSNEDTRNVSRINAMRKRHGLPPFQIVRSRVLHPSPLTPTHIGAREE